jgi:UDP-N-acetylglucosamine 2-epimerase
MKVLVLFGTRPEAIKLAPVIHELRKRFFQTIVVSSSQHKHLLAPFLESLEIDVDFDLGVMRRNQGPNMVCSRVMAKLDKILALEKPDLILVQGDTTTTLAGALAGFYRKIPVGGRGGAAFCGQYDEPVSGEMNRRVVRRSRRSILPRRKRTGEICLPRTCRARGYLSPATLWSTLSGRCSKISALRRRWPI